MKQKKGYAGKHNTKIPQFAADDSILIRKGYGKQSKFLGPFLIADIRVIDGIPKRIVYVDKEVSKVAALRNVASSSTAPGGTVFQRARVDGSQ